MSVETIFKRMIAIDFQITIWCVLVQSENQFANIWNLLELHDSDQWEGRTKTYCIQQKTKKKKSWGACD